MPTTPTLNEKPAARTNRDGLNLVWTVARSTPGKGYRNVCVPYHTAHRNK